MTRKLILALAVTLSAGLLFVNLYNSLVDAVSWGSNMPASIETARDYYKVVDPGNFFRIFSPANQVITLIALVLCWKTTRRIRLYCAIALLIAVLSDAFTFAYFYPRNEILFATPIDDLDVIKTAWAEWSSMNWVRSAMVLINVSFNFFCSRSFI